jgi:hypothetical protein
MARIVGSVVALLLLGLALLGIYVYQQVSTIEVAGVTPDLHAIYGLGSNVGVLRTNE